MLTSDAALFHSLVEAGRKKAGTAAKSDYAAFVLLGILAQEYKKYDVAREFFELAMKADVSKLSEVRDFGESARCSMIASTELTKIFRGIAGKSTPGGNGVFHFYLAGGWRRLARIRMRRHWMPHWLPPGSRQN